MLMPPMRSGPSNFSIRAIDKTTQRKGKLIFVVDDDPSAFLLIRRILERDGYRVVCMDNGQLLLEVIRFNKPDLIVMDVILPNEDGWEIFSKVRESRYGKDVPVVFVTALACSAEESQFASVRDSCRVLSKPIQPSHLLSAVSSLVS